MSGAESMSGAGGMNLTTAIVGFVGVIIGALINGGAAWLLHRKREKGAAKTASRLVYQEMMVNTAAIEVTAYHKEWNRLKDYLVTDAWEAKQEVLAGALPDEEWSPLVRAYYWVGQLINEGRDKKPTDAVDVDGVRFEAARREMHTAGPLLQPRAGATDPFVPWDAHMPPAEHHDHDAGES